MTSGTPTPDVGHLLRKLAPKVLGALAHHGQDFAAAEDAVQDALMAAAAQWPADGLPANPTGWLYHVAVRRLTDQARSEVARRRREDAVASEIWADWAFVPPADRDVDADEDDALTLLFMCCHPSLSSASAVALTLRAIGGLTTGEIAAAFLVPDATMAQRISRAKQTIKSSNVGFSVPSPDERAERLRVVLHVIYLIFSEGYVSSSGVALQRTDLANEGIRLARMLHDLLPADSEVTGLLALMLLTDARRAARTGPSGELIPLDAQDRTLWNRAFITEGVSLLSSVLPMGDVGAYQLQAAIAAVHDEAPRVEDTDWRQVLALYELLERISESPMIGLNRAIAVAMVHGIATGLDALAALDADPRIAGHYRLDAARAHLFEMGGRIDRAIDHYRRAAARTKSMPERDYLDMRAARLEERSAAPT